ncbi:MAG: peptidoglycan D,D-transpeptidase FtsI family protein [Patescibacteria group bacterium UBA2103]
MARGRITRRVDFEIEPDEVLLDASNLPHFDTNQFQGRIIAPIEKRSLVTFGIGAALVFIILIGELFSLQVSHGEEHALRSESNRLEQSILFATRGVVFDRNGEELISNVDDGETFSAREYRSPGFGHLLGYVTYPKKDSAGFYFSTEIEGVSGLEAVLDERLQGENGLVLVESTARGEVRSSEAVLKPINGENVTLSIDARIQESLYTHIKTLADQIPFRGGAGIIMDIHTGEVLALTNYPEYDPNVLAAGDDRDTIVSYQNDSRKPYLNRAISGLFAPGSVVKPFVAIAALEENVVDITDTFLSTGQISIPNPYFPDQPTIFRDWKAHGYVNVVRALAVSSNVYFYIVGGGYNGQEGLGIDRLASWFSKFEFNKPTGIGLNNEATGFIPTPAWKKETFGEDWRIGDTYYTAIGQYAVQTTPIAMVRAVAAIANGGDLVTPTVLKGEIGPKKHISFSEETRQIVISGMKEVVNNSEVGTARGVKNNHVSVAAKTGTAQVGNNNSLHNAWIEGYFPVENPKYAFVVVMERGPSSNLIGAVSVMRNVLEDIAISAPEYFTVDGE